MITLHHLTARASLTPLLGAACLLACVSIAAADPKPLSKEERDRVDAAIDKGVEYLKGAQAEEGNWRWVRYEDSHPVGTCALPAYALLESGVPADDPVIQKAAKFLRPRVRVSDLTYDLALAILFFDRLGDLKDKTLIQSMALRLIAGQSQAGGWGYQTRALSAPAAETLLDRLGELNKRRKGGEKPRSQALRGMEVPLPLQSLTVFQSAENLTWTEPAPLGRPLADNSNTQFALLGLWASRRHDVPVEPALEISVERFERYHIYPEGFWTYDLRGKSFGPASRPSMTCAGLMGLAMGRGLKLPTPGSPVGKEKDVHILRGFATLTRWIGKSRGDMMRKTDLRDLYYLWSLERVGMLYDLPTIGDKDWYRWGAEILVSNQKKGGWWPGWGGAAANTPIRHDMSNYGASLNTAFALLFLKRAHPMKDLTPKLPIKAKELNEGIASLRPSDKYPARTVVAPSPSKDDGR